MDDMYGLLFNGQAPEKQLLTAVTCNMLSTLDQLLATEKVNVNAVLQEQNGNTALHVASYDGSHGCVRRLLVAGADTDIQNRFGFTALSLALRKSQTECIRVLFGAGGKYSDPMLIWQSVNLQDLPMWLTYMPDAMEVLLIATQNFASLTKSLQEHFSEVFLENCNNPALMKAFFITGNKLVQAKFYQIMMNSKPADKEWLRTFVYTPTSLQHHARLAIRRHVRLNVLWAHKQLPLPVKLQEYLVSSEDV